MNYEIIPEFETAPYLHANAIAVVNVLYVNTVSHNLVIISSFYSAHRKQSYFTTVRPIAYAVGTVLPYYTGQRGV